MASIFEISPAVQDTLLATLAGLFNGGKLNIYGGTVPASCGAALGSAVLLRSIGDGTGISFEPVPVSGMIVKSTSEDWSAPNVATGTATFYRFVTQADDGLASDIQPRLQGSVGLLDADLILGSINLVIGVTDPSIGIYMVGLPAA